MIKTRDILIAHNRVDGHLAAFEAKARTAARRTYWADRRVLNDHAYFVLVFGRFEQHVKDQCIRLISKKQAGGQWRRRRLWDGIDLNHIDFMEFMKKVALLIDKGHHHYGRIRTLYKDFRCAIAHGDSAAVGPIVLPTLASELRTLSGILKTQ